MELEDICKMYNISNIDYKMFSLNDIAKNIIKKHQREFIKNVKDKKKIGKYFYINSKTFIKIIHDTENDECKLIINMMTGKIDEKEDIFIKQIKLKELQLRYRIQCEKTKQMEIQRDIKVLESSDRHKQNCDKDILSDTSSCSENMSSSDEDSDDKEDIEIITKKHK
uniref:Uncharacterized protein n=1 Tax=viral metagenome TaxID=1070528 RepID=A0A6C0E9D7_9ZZZZ